MKKSTRLLAFFCAFTLLFSYSFMPKANNTTTSAVSDTSSDVPTIFRQNDVYSNEERTPLVVKDGVEYVPISVFSLYSYVDVEYSKTDENFFLVNTKNNHYISFNTEQSLASTYDGDLLTMPVEIFNQTRYIPAKTVAVVLGFDCETYEDEETGSVVLRVSDGKSNKTLDQMVNSYIEENKKADGQNAPSGSQNAGQQNQTTLKPEEPPKEYEGNEIFKQGDTANLIFPEVPPSATDSNVGQNTQSAQNNGNTNDSQTNDENKEQDENKNDDLLSDIAERKIGLCFAGISYSETEKIINTLNKHKIGAAFVLNKQDILSKPETVRRLYSSGQGLLITGAAEGETAEEYADSFVSGLEQTNEALKIVLKKKTRMCMLPGNMPEEIKTDEVFLEKVKEAGYLIFTPNFDAGDRPDFNGSAYVISEKLKKQISEGFEYDKEGVVTSLMLCSNKTYYYVLDIAAFVNRYNRMEFFALNESFLYNN